MWWTSLYAKQTQITSIRHGTIHNWRKRRTAHHFYICLIKECEDLNYQAIIISPIKKCIHLIHSIWKCFILIGWLVFTIFEQYTWQRGTIPSNGNYIIYQFQTISQGHYTCSIVFTCYFYICLARFKSVKMDGALLW
jgi:hypothetical protein